MAATPPPILLRTDAVRVQEFAGHISRALEDIAGVMATEVLPALDMLCLEDQPVSSDHKFIAARWESGRPVTTVNTRKVFEERLSVVLSEDSDSDSDAVSDIVLV